MEQYKKVFDKDNNLIISDAQRARSEKLVAEAKHAFEATGRMPEGLLDGEDDAVVIHAWSKLTDNRDICGGKWNRPFAAAVHNTYVERVLDVFRCHPSPK